VQSVGAAGMGFEHASILVPPVHVQTLHVPPTHSALLLHSCAEATVAPGHLPFASFWHVALAIATLSAARQHASSP